MSLFSPREVEGLMRAEFERSQRYGFPLVCMVVTVDRIGALADLYGSEAREEILLTVEQSLREATRDSDLLLLMRDDRLIALFPHAAPEVANVVAKKLLATVRKMRFDRDGRTLRATVSIGVSHSRQRNAISFDTLIEVAEEGLRVADAAGGDRFVETELYLLVEKQRKDREEPARAGAASASAPSPAPVPAAQWLGETLLEMLAAQGWKPGPNGQIDRETLMRLLVSLQDKRAEPHDAGELAEVKRQNELLERRIAKLTSELGLTAEQLRRIAELKSFDPGLASIYKSVQGLSGNESHAERKREMMKEIFDANFALKKTLQQKKPS